MTAHAIADYMDRPCPAVLIDGEYICMHEWERTRETIPYVAWGGRVRHLPVTFDLGHTAAPPAGQRGLRRAIYDAAYGHVNGYPASAILYFVLTRSLNDTICKRVLAWEAKRRAAAEDPDGSGRESAAERHTRNLLTGCPRCDQHGPDLPPMRLSWSISERRDFHRAWHDLGRALTNLYRAHRGTLELPEEPR